MKIKDRIEFKSKAPVMTFAPDDMVIKAVKAMSEKNYGASVIVDGNNKPIGIVTERDFMRRLLAKGLDANATPISEIMTSDLKLASEEDQVVEWLWVMSNERFRHLPVVDSQGKLVNLMSQGDFVSYTWPQLLTRAKDAVAKSFMERFHLHLLVGGVMFYSIIMVFVMRSVK
ncbi:MAG: CBS domain-containing protein [Proteobacteria bacterium]|nr:CBS domain-containing protein [Pseudomonadota bacterium]